MQDKFERMDMCLPIFEISSESSITGRRPIKLILHEVHPDVDHYQENGISWDEKYVSANLHSVHGMSITVEFLTDDRDIPYGHGMTGIRDTDNMPLFEDATMVGFFERAYIDDIEINGEKKRVLIAEGTLDEMRYPKFVSWLREHMTESVVKGSVEIVGKPEHEGHIIYSGGWKEKGRVPQIYDYSGYAILGVKPADALAIVMELNNRKQTESEGEKNMNEELKKAVEDGITNAFTEQNSKWDQYWANVQAKEAEITQLNADIAAKKAEIAAKDAEIAQLRADLEAEQAKSAAAEAGITEANSKVAELEKEKAISELNAALEPFTEEQRAVAQEDIAAFQADPTGVEINSIVGKICTEMVRLSREAGVAETNSAIDVFGMVEEHKPQDDSGEVDVF